MPDLHTAPALSRFAAFFPNIPYCPAQPQLYSTQLQLKNEADLVLFQLLLKVVDWLITSIEDFELLPLKTSSTSIKDFKYLN